MCWQREQWICILGNSTVIDKLTGWNTESTVICYSVITSRLSDWPAHSILWLHTPVLTNQARVLLFSTTLACLKMLYAGPLECPSCYPEPIQSILSWHGAGVAAPNSTEIWNGLTPDSRLRPRRSEGCRCPRRCLQCHLENPRLNSSRSSRQHDLSQMRARRYVTVVGNLLLKRFFVWSTSSFVR